jgi:nucleotide-binding universal stress UspA family protein
MGFRHILFPVDFSPRCYGAVPFVRALAARYKAAVTLVHVIEATHLKEETEQQLATFATQEFPLMSVTRMVEEGDPGACISELAQVWNADLIMMPTHGHGALRQQLLGSVTAKILHDCECAIWTGTDFAPAHTELKTILCAIELAPESVSLLKYAKEIAFKAGATVHIVHAVPAAEVRPEINIEQPLEAFLHDFARDEIAKLQIEAGTNFDSFVELGSVSQVVCKAAGKFDADLVVIGRGVVNRFAGDLRTEAYGIMRESPCPVLSV